MRDPGPNDFAEAVDLIRRSAIWATIDRAAALWRIGVQHSTVIAASQRMLHAFEALSRHERFRAIALTVAVGAAAHALLVGLIPPPVRPALPRMFWVVVSGIAAAATMWRRGQASDA